MVVLVVVVVVVMEEVVMAGGGGGDVACECNGTGARLYAARPASCRLMAALSGKGS